MRHLCGTAGRTQFFFHAVAGRETSAPSGIHCALVIRTEDLVSGVLEMPGLNSLHGFWLTSVGIRVEGRCQVGGQGQGANPEERSLSSQSAS